MRGRQVLPRQVLALSERCRCSECAGRLRRVLESKTEATLLFSVLLICSLGISARHDFRCFSYYNISMTKYVTESAEGSKDLFGFMAAQDIRSMDLWSPALEQGMSSSWTVLTSWMIRKQTVSKRGQGWYIPKDSPPVTYFLQRGFNPHSFPNFSK